MATTTLFIDKRVTVNGQRTLQKFDDALNVKQYIEDVVSDNLLSTTQVLGFFPIAAEQALSGPGAINLTSYHTKVTTTGTDALTLADSTQIGQLKKITLVADGGDGTLTLTGYTSITFDDAGDYVVLVWTGSAWQVIENSGTTIV